MTWIYIYIYLLKFELLLSYLVSFLSSTYKITTFIGVLWCKHVYIFFVSCPCNRCTFYFCSLEWNVNFLGSLFPRIFCSFLNLTRVLTTTKIKQENKDSINTFTAIVDRSRFNNSCLKSPTSTLVDLTFQSRALRSFSLNQLRNLLL